MNEINCLLCTEKETCPIRVHGPTQCASFVRRSCDTCRATPPTDGPDYDSLNEFGGLDPCFNCIDTVCRPHYMKKPSPVVGMLERLWWRVRAPFVRWYYYIIH